MILASGVTRYRTRTACRAAWPPRKPTGRSNRRRSVAGGEPCSLLKASGHCSLGEIRETCQTICHAEAGCQASCNFYICPPGYMPKADSQNIFGEGWDASACCHACERFTSSGACPAYPGSSRAWNGDTCQAIWTVNIGSCVSIGDMCPESKLP